MVAWQLRVAVLQQTSLPHLHNKLVRPCETCFVRPLLPPAILDATRPGGLICYQTFTAEKQINKGPSNPEFLLQPNELQSFVPDCEILAFKDESHNVNRDDPLAGRAFIIARKPIG